jgi:hypothetical protein
MNGGGIDKGIWRKGTALAAVTATTTSEEIDILGAKKVTLEFTRANHSAGSSTFTVDVSLDGTTYVTFAKLVTNAAATNAQTQAKAASVVLSSNTTAIVSLDLQYDAFMAMKITVTEATDGTHTAKYFIEK